jgi:nicotinate-nucleotide adenylyltransferase
MMPCGPQPEEDKCTAAPRVAFFGGSFDPPHLGHLAVARAALLALHLDRVLFAPVGAQPLKPQGSSSGFAQRVAMTRLAIAGETAFNLSLADAPKTGGAPNYTFDTLDRLRSELPVGCELFCLMGADSFAGMRRWHRGAEIPFLAPLIVASRPGERLDDLRALLPLGLFLESETKAEAHSAGIQMECYRLGNAAGESARFYLLPGLEVEISASQIREQLRHADFSALTPPLALLPPAVARYIHAQKLYH